MARHKPSVTSTVAARQRDLAAIDEQISRLWRSYRNTHQAASLAAIDDLLDRRSNLTCTLGELLNHDDRASTADWGPADLGTSA